MKKGLRRGIFGLATLAALAGCGIDSECIPSNVITSENKRIYIFIENSILTTNVQSIPFRMV